MQSSNPVFARSEGFNGRRTSQSGVTYPDYNQPYSAGTGAPQAPDYYAPAQPQAPMTIDSVVQKSAITLGLVIVSAALTWFFTGDPRTDQTALSGLYALSLFGAFAGLALVFVISFKKAINPGLVLAYAVVEGIFVGAMSKTFEAMWPGVVSSAVLGTMAAVIGTLAAYKFFNIRVTPKFQKFTMAAVLGFFGLVMLDFVLSFFGVAVGFNGFGTLGLIMSVIGLALGVLMLILDFDLVERGVAARLPEKESWRAAFGLTVTIIWIYVEMLRILAILRGQD